MVFASELQDLFEPYQQFLDVGKTFKLRGASMGGVSRSDSSPQRYFWTTDLSNHDGMVR